MKPYEIDYKKVKNLELIIKIKNNGYKSLTEFCEEADIDRSTLHRIIYGIQKISFESGFKINKTLEGNNLTTF